MAFPYNELKEFLGNGKRRHFYFDGCNKEYFRFLPHSDGVYPTELIECRRPNEPDVVKDYRKEIYKPKTKPPFSRVLLSLSKIRRSPDWSIKYPDDTAQEFKAIPEDETLQAYCEENYPGFTSVTNWVFSVLLKQDIIDPNGVVFVWPLAKENPDDVTEYLRPVAEVFNSPQVISFEENDHAILNDPIGCFYWQTEKRVRIQKPGLAYYEVDRNDIIRWEQSNDKGDYREAWRVAHNMPELPVFKMKALIKESTGRHIMYESRISGILPDFDEAVRDYSDLQGAKVTGLHPERWEFTQNQCVECKGTGQRRSEREGKPCIDQCTKCEGHGYIAAGPYSKMLVRPMPNTQNGTVMPIPPAGYVQKDIAMIELMIKTVKQDIFDGLAAINFQFLEQTPLNESGTAKEVDKDELNNTVHGIAEDIVWIMDQIYKFIAWYRYGTQYKYDYKKVSQLLPAIAVPDHFDLLSADFMQADLAKAKTAKLNPVIINTMEVEYAQKRFANEQEVAERLALILKLNPLPNVSEEEKMTMLSNKGITQVNYVISCNINSFVERAIEEDEDFVNADTPDQRAVMVEYAEEVIAANKTARVTLGPEEGDANAEGNNAGNTGEENPSGDGDDPDEEIVDAPPVIEEVPA